MDDPARECTVRVRLSPFDWYCAKRPYTYTRRDLPRLAGLPSVLIRKVHPDDSAGLLDAVDSWVDGTGAPPAMVNFSAPVALAVPSAQFPCLQFSTHVPPPEARSRDVQTLLQWGFGSCGTRAAFLLTDCVGSAPRLVVSVDAEGTQRRCMHSECGGEVCQCRIRPAELPSLCLTAREDVVRAGALLGFAPCKVFREAQVFRFDADTCTMRSSARVSVEPPYREGLCVTARGSGLHSVVLEVCRRGAPQAVEVAELG
eukprot:TRINITY_DN16618_c0_g1_i2.p2 TRINITY_DN16618_c0_g1~~TRINITY_DN16618_c0_g1_i2.p2  ORF type:complete len:257 (+),score=73.96 TRINITY_DN16618_c0_g1_i2:1072-1842(+)